MKKFLFLFLISTALSCQTATSPPADQNQWLIDSLALENYVQDGVANCPNGISPSLMRGYTDRVNGIYHAKELNLKSLQITGLRFERKESDWGRRVCYYQFSFKDKKEEVKFENFQKLIQNYQTHGKNQVAFFKRNSIWYLKFIPMP